MYPRIGFFRKLPYPRIRILPIPIRVSVSMLHSSKHLVKSSLKSETPFFNFIKLVRPVQAS